MGSDQVLRIITCKPSSKGHPHQTTRTTLGSSVVSAKHNNQKKKDKRTNNDLQNTTQTTKDSARRTPINWTECSCCGRVSSSCSTSGTRRVTLVTNLLKCASSYACLTQPIILTTVSEYWGIWTILVCHCSPWFPGKISTWLGVADRSPAYTIRSPGLLYIW